MNNILIFTSPILTCIRTAERQQETKINEPLHEIPNAEENINALPLMSQFTVFRIESININLITSTDLFKSGKKTKAKEIGRKKINNINNNNTRQYGLSTHGVG